MPNFGIFYQTFQQACLFQQARLFRTLEYYEADCTMNGLNPFVPLDSENPTLAAFRQKPLKVSKYNRSN